MKSKVRILGVSDVATGYGSPQVLAFMRSLVEHYEGAEATLIEPDQVEATPRQNGHLGLSVQRIATTFHPYMSTTGRIEYIRHAAKITNRLRPDILVLFCTYTLPVLFKLSRKPFLVIYYAYEMTFPYGQRDIEMNRCLSKSSVDLIVYPDADRAVRDMQVCGHRDIPLVIVLNSADTGEDDVGAACSSQRNGRLIYSGTIDRVRTLADYYFREEMKSIPVDLFGRVSGSDSEGIEYRLKNIQAGALRYFGLVPADDLRVLRKDYCFSIVIWNPIDEQHLYACPNKFFEAIVDGVPPITAPHPQAKAIVQRYKCGIVMDDWSFEAFYAAIRRAMRLYGTSAYDSMVENCRTAFSEELNWQKQFAKVKPYLREVK